MIVNSRSLEGKIFVTKDFHGHRLNWFRNIYNLQSPTKLPVRIFSFSNIGLHNSQSAMFDITFISSKQELERLMASTLMEEPGVEFVFLEADQWLKDLARTKVRFRALVVRPYLSNFGPKSILHFIVKLFLYFIISNKRAANLVFLSTPHQFHFLMRSRWVQDNLTPSDIDFKMLEQAPENSAFTIVVPGFISTRKNPALIAELANRLEMKFPGEFLFKFTGEMSQEVRSFFENKLMAPILVSKSYLERHEYLQVLETSDLILLLYANRGPSGVQIEGLTLGVQVAMFSDYIWIGLQKFANGQLVLLQKDLEKIEDYLLSIRDRRGRVQVAGQDTYEFNDVSHTKGVVDFIFKE